MKTKTTTILMFVSYVYGLAIGNCVQAFAWSNWIAFILGLPMGIFIVIVYIKGGDKNGSI